MDTTPDADPCSSGVCECTVETEATDCGAHEYCNATPTGRTCECVAGYTDGGAGCVWTGTVQDTGFQTQTAWTATRGALLNPTAPGSVDAGEVSYVASAICGLGTVAQTFDMPTRAKAEPLVLEVSYKNQRQFQTFDEVLMGIGFGGKWTPLPAYNDGQFRIVRTCLGAAGYAAPGTSGKGAPVTLGLGPYREARNCPNTSVNNFAIDYAKIVPANAGECGAVFGTALNGDAEGNEGWTFSSETNSTAGFVGGVGAGGTRGARMSLITRCTSASMSTRADIVDSANPAIEMYVSATNQTLTTLGVTLAEYLRLPVSLGTPGSVRRFCLPPAMRGHNVKLVFSLNGSGTCAEANGTVVVVDNIKTVDEPSCASTAAVVSPGFESPGGILPGLSSEQYQRALVRTGAAQARSGTGYLSLESLGRCYSAGYQFVALTPVASGAAGPALTFYSNIPVNPDATTTVTVYGKPSVTLAEGGGYQKQTVCLPPSHIGRPVDVSINHYGGGGTCDTTAYVQQNALIDDIELTTDPACPAQ